MSTAPDRILVTRLNFLGDVVLSLPLVDALRARFPEGEIDYLTRDAGADLLEGDARFARVFRQRSGARESLRLVRALRARRYRAVIDLYANPRSAWLTFASGAPVRIGGDRRGRRRFYTHPVTVPASVRRVTDIFMRYGEPLGVRGAAGMPVVPVSAAESARAEATLRAAGTGGRPLVGVHPGGKWSVKRWPARHFAELIAILGARGFQVVVFTGPDEPDATRTVRGLAGDAAHYLPAMGVREVAAVISRLDGMVACDGGVMHVAAAVGTPTVGVFGSSEPEVWFPYLGDGRMRPAFIEVECRPCHRHVCPLGHTRCLNDLDAALVAARVDDVLRTAQADRAR